MVQDKHNLFMASISHELRTPLTSILGYGELLDNTNLDSRQQEYLDRMLNSSKYLLSLVGDFLDIVKIENDDIHLDVKEVRIHTLLSECADVIKSSLSKEVEFEVAIPFLNYTILADDRRIKQVVLNLLSNAAKFTKKGKIKFYVSDIIETEEGVKIAVNVEDTGKGMSREMQRALFDPFVSGDSTQGFGLGLFISKELVRLMDGEISVVSKEGEGSTFTASFTVVKAQEKVLSKALSGKNILFLSADPLENEFSRGVKSRLSGYGAIFRNYHAEESISSTLKKIFTNSIEWDIAIFDTRTLSCAIEDLITTLKMMHPSIKCVAIKDKHEDLPTSSFDKLINAPFDEAHLVYELEELSAEEKRVENSAIDFSHLKVLVVEDVEMSREYIKEMLLISFAIDCDTAVNGEDGVAQAKETKYDVIFMDIRMPVMNGYDASREIRKFDEKVSIICLSADAQEQVITDALGSGMNAFIEKPLEKDAVKNTLLQIDGEAAEHIDLTVKMVPSLKSDRMPASAENYDPAVFKKEVYDHLSKNFDDEIIKTLLQSASASIKMYVTNIKVNMIEKDTSALADDFHAIKGVLANLGLKVCAESAGKIQHKLQDGDFRGVTEAKKEFLKKMNQFLVEMQ